MSFSLTKLLVGRRIANREAGDRKLGVLTGLPLFWNVRRGA